MSYTDFSSKIGTMDDAASKIESGDVIWIGSALSVPYGFLDKLAERAESLRDVTLVGNMFIRKHEILSNTKYQDSFKIFSIINTQAMPAPMANVHFVYSTSGSVEQNVCKRFGINAMAVEVCPPDNDGTCNLGAFGTYITAFVSRYSEMKKRILVINDSQPEGGKEERNFINLSTGDCIVISHHKLYSSTAGY